MWPSKNPNGEYNIEGILLCLLKSLYYMLEYALTPFVLYCAQNYAGIIHHGLDRSDEGKHNLVYNCNVTFANFTCVTIKTMNKCLQNQHSSKCPCNGGQCQYYFL